MDIPSSSKFVVWQNEMDGQGWEPCGYETKDETIAHIEGFTDGSTAYYVTTGPLKVTTTIKLEQPNDPRT